MKPLLVLLWRRNLCRMEALHIPPHRLQILLRPNEKFSVGVTATQPDTAVAGICYQFKIVCNDKNGLFFSHLTNQFCTPFQAFGILPGGWFVQYDNRFIGKICHHQRKSLHLPA